MRGKFGVNTGRVDWLTPPCILDALGPFDLDPCCPVSPPWKTANIMYSPVDDGLSKPWFGQVWLNPPYGNEISRWMRKMAEYGSGFGLVCARTETKWFQDFVFSAASAILFLRGRIHFFSVDGKRAVGNAGAPSVIAAYGPGAAAKLRESEICGRFVEL